MGTLLILTLLAVGVAAWSRRMVAPTAGDLAWLAGTDHRSRDETLVYSRYLTRHRRHRFAGGCFGVAFAVVMGIRWSRSVNVGIGEHNPLSDVLFCGLAGVLLGALSAETFRLSEGATGVRTASLAAREDPLPRTGAAVCWGLTATSLVAGGAVLAFAGNAGPLLIGVAGLGTAMSAALTQRAIRARQRPALSDAARRVDSRLRHFAGHTVARLQFAASVLVIGWVVSTVPRTDATLLELGRAVIVIGCLAVTVIELRRAAPRPPRHRKPAA